MLLDKSFLLLFVGIVSATALPRQNSANIVIGNDDGWATTNIRSLYSAIKGAGYKTLISAPADNRSGTGSTTAEPTPLQSPGEFNTIPAGAPPTGKDSSDPNIYYVNSYPATAIEYGIETFASEVFGAGAKADFAVAGVNVGVNLGSTTQISGTVGAAAHAVQLGVPAIAFSGAGSSQHIYTEPDAASNVYAQVSLKLVNAVIASGEPYLPAGVALNVNFPKATSSTCSKLSDYSFVLTRIYANSSTTDVTQCGTNHLPTEQSVFSSGKCRVPISVFNASTKRDVESATQKVVRDKITSLLSCVS